MDPFRRVYLKSGLVYKVVLANKETTGHRRANTLHGEYKILKQCEGVRGVPLLKEFFSTGNADVLVLQQVEGVPIDPNSLDLYSFLKILSGTARVVRRLSSRGVSHNDITFSNILLGKDGEVTIVDFDQATTESMLVALLRSVLGIEVGTGKVQSSLVTLLKVFMKTWLPPSILRGIRVILGRARRDSLSVLPVLTEDASPGARLLLDAWKKAQNSDASSPGEWQAYYSLEFEGIHFPGERPWESRWPLLRAVTDFKNKRVLELGCNMGLLSSYLLLHEGIDKAMMVDCDKDILAAARMVNAALGVEADILQVDFDLDDNWEADLRRFGADVLFALNVLNWLADRERFVKFLGEFEEVVFEGHDSLRAEMELLGSVGFSTISIKGTTERGRHLLHCSR